MGYPQSFITIRDGHEVSIELPVSHEILAHAVRELEDTDDNASVFEVFATHPSSEVRQEVAGMSQLNESTVHLLATDPSVEVVRTLVLTEAFDAHASHDEVMAVIGRDTLIAMSVAEKFERLENVDMDAVVQKLLSISDPTVAAALAGNHETPRQILSQLTEHPDPQVRITAMQSLT